MQEDKNRERGIQLKQQGYASGEMQSEEERKNKFAMGRAQNETALEAERIRARLR